MDQVDQILDIILYWLNHTLTIIEGPFNTVTDHLILRATQKGCRDFLSVLPISKVKMTIPLGRIGYNCYHIA